MRLTLDPSKFDAARKEVADFNRDFPVGTPVIYQEVLPLGSLPGTEPIHTKIRSQAFTYGALTAVCLVEGISGWVCCSHISKIDSPSS